MTEESSFVFINISQNSIIRVNENSIIPGQLVEIFEQRDKMIIIQMTDEYPIAFVNLPLRYRYYLKIHRVYNVEYEPDDINTTIIFFEDEETSDKAYNEFIFMLNAIGIDDRNLRQDEIEDFSSDDNTKYYMDGLGIRTINVHEILLINWDEGHYWAILTDKKERVLIDKRAIYIIETDKPFYIVESDSEKYITNYLEEDDEIIEEYQPMQKIAIA